jgi:two-component system, sensor histidine kinase and response regulator
LEANNASAVKRVAHTLKGSSASLGARLMPPICEELEALGQSGDLVRAPDLLTRLEAEFGHVRDALTTELEC